MIVKETTPRRRTFDLKVDEVELRAFRSALLQAHFHPDSEETRMDLLSTLDRLKDL